MGIEIVKHLEEKMIQWITLEAEVMDEVHKRFFEGKLTRDEWNDYFVSLVKKYGNAAMLDVIMTFRIIQDTVIKAVGLENVTEYMKELYKY